MVGHEDDPEILLPASLDTHRKDIRKRPKGALHPLARRRYSDGIIEPQPVQLPIGLRTRNAATKIQREIRKQSRPSAIKDTGAALITESLDSNRRKP